MSYRNGQYGYRGYEITRVFEGPVYNKGIWYVTRKGANWSFPVVTAQTLREAKKKIDSFGTT